MRGKLTVAAVLLLLTSVLAPVWAKSIGPQKAVKNPHISIAPNGAELILPSGVINEWMSDTSVGVMDFVHMLDASKAKIPNALPLTFDDLLAMISDPDAAAEFENTWGYVSHDVLVDLLVFSGFSEAEAEAFAAMWPEGLYVRFVNVGH